MAHSLFEPTPLPISERLWKRVKALNIGQQAQCPQESISRTCTDPVLALQAQRLDARGRQQLLNAVLTNKPIK